MIPILLAILVRIIPIDGHEVRLVTDPAEVATCERVEAVTAGVWHGRVRSPAALEAELAAETVKAGGNVVHVVERRKRMTWPRAHWQAWGIAYKCTDDRGLRGGE